MLKKSITYTNPFNDEEVTQEFYFHISKAELIEMEVSKKGGMEAYLKQIVEAEDGEQVMSALREIIRRAYGKKEGDLFVKTQAGWEEFASSEAYSTFFFELVTDADKAAEFVNAVFPKGLDEEAAKIVALNRAREAHAQRQGALATEQIERAEALTGDGSMAAYPSREAAIAAATPENPVYLIDAELQEIDASELKSGLATGRYKLS